MNEKLLEKIVTVRMPLKKWVSVIGIVQYYLDRFNKKHIEQIEEGEYIIKIVQGSISNQI